MNGLILLLGQHKLIYFKEESTCVYALTKAIQDERNNIAYNKYLLPEIN